ncbi:MAG: efflux RND transporter permease subunit, partial [Leptospiraceae bacterium]|nr:efflux RND transporter permease subunit [Leptospiraceae bacterium]
MKEFLIQIKARPVLISMLVLALLLFGLISFYRLNFSLYPSPVYPGLSIHLDFPGADPLKMEQQITNPIEEAISIVGGIKEMRSFSEAGKMKVNIEFEKETDLNYKILELKERIDLVSHKFPREAHKPGIIKYDPEQVPVFIVSFKSEKMDLTAIREYLERFIKPELESIEGISQIIIAGGRVREVLVSCDRQQMEAYAISLREVVDALSSNNTNQTITKIYKDAREQKVYSDGKFKDLYEIRELPVSLDNGRNPVLIKDIAEVKMAFRDEDSSSRVNAKEMVSLYIYKTYIGDPLHISKQSKKIIEALYHRNTNYEVTFDQGDLI